MSINSVKELVKNLPFKTMIFNKHGITFFNQQELVEGQIGYSRNEKGYSLCKGEAGSWKNEWIVIGYEIFSGEPIFLDVSKSVPTVHIASCWENEWVEEEIAENFTRFIEVLDIIKDYFDLIQDQSVFGEEHPQEYKDKQTELLWEEKEMVMKRIYETPSLYESDFWDRFLSHWTSDFLLNYLK